MAVDNSLTPRPWTVGQQKREREEIKRELERQSNARNTATSTIESGGKVILAGGIDVVEGGGITLLDNGMVQVYGEGVNPLYQPVTVTTMLQNRLRTHPWTGAQYLSPAVWFNQGTSPDALDAHVGSVYGKDVEIVSATEDTKYTHVGTNNKERATMTAAPELWGVNVVAWNSVTNPLGPGSGGAELGSSGFSCSTADLWCITADYETSKFAWMNITASTGTMELKADGGVRVNGELILRNDPVFYSGTDDFRLDQANDAAAFYAEPLNISENLIITDNIPGFWDRHPQGLGTITRESQTFHVTPRPTQIAIPINNLYVNSSTGSDFNDGLSPSFAFQTIEGVYKYVLRRLTAEQAAGARWVVNLAGQFEGGTTMTDLPEFPHLLQFVGEPLVSGSPVTKIYKGATSDLIGLWLEPCRTTIQVYNVWFDGWAVGFNGYGLLAKGGGALEAFDCKATGCDTGFAAIKNVDFTFVRCVATDANSGGFLAQYSSSGAFQYCTSTNAGLYGFFITRNSVVHIDYCTTQDNPTGVLVDMAARANIMETHFKRNDFGVKTEGAAEWVDTDNFWYVGTADANGSVWQNSGVGRETRQYSQSSKNEFMIGECWAANPAYLDPQEVTATSSTVVYLGSALGKVPAAFFDGNRKKIRACVYGYSSAALPYSVEVRLNTTNTDGTGLAILAAGLVPGGTNGPFKVELEAWAVTLTSQKTFCVGDGAGTTNKTLVNPGRTVDFTNEKLFRVYAHHTGGTGSVPAYFTKAEIFMMG